MSKVDVVFGNKTYTLTNEVDGRGIVLSDAAGNLYGPYDTVGGSDIQFGHVLTMQMTARAIADYIKDDQPDNEEAMKLLADYLAIPAYSNK